MPKKPKTIRILSMETMVYHKPNCSYAKRIRKRNKKEAPREEALHMSFRPCKCCNALAYHLNNEINEYTDFAKKHNLELKYIQPYLYVKTNMGCWKIVYSKRSEKLRLYHGNRTSKPLDFHKPQFEHYHAQSDHFEYNKIMAALRYIESHDSFFEAEQKGEHVTYTHKKYLISKKKREKQAASRRLNKLFRQIESQDSSMLAASIC